MTRKLSPRIKNWEKNAVLKAKFCRNSFSPSTKVWTKGGLVAIATLFALDGTGLAKQTPDEVWSYNEQTQKNELKTVEHVFINEDDYITTLELFDPETRRNETITTTPEHPFYVSSKEKEPWTGAGELEVDDEIRKADGNVGIVLFVRTKLQKKTMYNLSVSDNHNFFVGDNKWLTHNAGKCNSLTNSQHFPQVPNAPSKQLPANAPKGRNGSPLEIPRGTNIPQEINRIDYSGHALDQMQGRGIPLSVVEEAIAHGIVKPGGLPGTWEFFDAKNGVSVIVSSTSSKIITVITKK